MCGIAGICFADGRPVDQRVLEEMSGGLKNRGPDGGGSWQNEGCEPALVHRRLSILDLSPAGAQPMATADGQSVLVFNGEIYNHLQLRAELQGRGESFRGTSDTETLMVALRRWGVDETLPQLNGMFAFGWWDRTSRVLTLARDRIGIKPLYLLVDNATLWFGSTLKAIPRELADKLHISPAALTAYMECGYIPGRQSIFANVIRVHPGTVVSIRFTGGHFRATHRNWWQLSSSREEFVGDATEATHELDRLLSDSVKKRLLSDVPVGAFLSGGIDSSLVVSVMQEHSNQPVNTFSIGVDDPRFDESDKARAVASHLRTHHETLKFGESELINLIPQMPNIYDEPFADSSQLPTLLVSQLARQQVTVCLSGDGGDELFHGYSWYDFAPRYWQVAAKIPASMRWLVNFLPLQTGVKCQLTKATRSSSMIDYFGRLGNDSGDVDVLLPEFRSRWSFDRALQVAAADPSSVLSGVDILHWLPDDILYKVDRASMAVGLEARVPLLDHRIVEFSRRIPAHWKCSEGVTKRPLRALLEKRVPSSLLAGPKQGFGLPIRQWLGSGLRDWVNQQIGWSDPRLPWQPTSLAALHDRVIAGGDGLQTFWRVLNFNAWFRNYTKSPLSA